MTPQIFHLCNPNDRRWRVMLGRALLPLGCEAPEHIHLSVSLLAAISLTPL